MSKPTHTPGPWEHTGQGDIVGKEDNGYGLGYVDVCSVYLRTVRGRTNANSRLIAAAPDLLAALREIADDYADRFDLTCPSTNPGIKSTIAQARAAIAKATTGA